MLSDLVSDSLRPLRAAYWDSVKTSAVEIHQEHPNPADDERSDLAHEVADSSEWVIYTRNAYLVALLSEHADAWRDGTHPATPDRDEEPPDVDAIVTTAAYYAMRADLESELARLADARN